MRHGARRWLPVILAGVTMLYGTYRVHACAIDGVPSLRADGVQAVLNRATPSKATLNHWAPFIFASVVRAGEIVHFSENVRELARTLPPEIVRGEWLWRMDDGKPQWGRMPAHRFAKPGTYLITVAVELPRHGGTFVFDAALLRVGK